MVNFSIKLQDLNFIFLGLEQHLSVIIHVPQNTTTSDPTMVDAQVSGFLDSAAQILALENLAALSSEISSRRDFVASKLFPFIFN